MRYGSVCSGIEAATAAWHALGWKPSFFSEIEDFPRAALKHHYPDVPLHGDFTTIEADQYDPIDLLVGGTPCQSFSIAGKRGGLGDNRGNLSLEYCLLADRLRPRWLAWENVPGAFSVDGGEAFASIISGLVRWAVPVPRGGWQNSGICAPADVDGAYGVAWRVLDAQYVRTLSHPWAVPQRRRRLFVVGYLGDWRRAAAVLFDRESLQGNPAPRREAGKGAAGTLSARTKGGGGLGTDFDLDGGLIANSGEVGYCLAASAQQSLDAETETLIATVSAENNTHALTAEGYDASEDGTGRGTPIVAFGSKDNEADAIEGVSPTLRAGGHDGSHANGGVPPAVAFDMRGREGGAQFEGPHDTANIRASSGGSSRSYILEGLAYGYAEEADASSALQFLRELVGEEAVQKWCFAILTAFQSPEILQSWLHGESLRSQAKNFESFVDDCALPRPENLPGGIMRSLWVNGPNGCSSQGRGLAKQLLDQFRAPLPIMPQQGT